MESKTFCMLPWVHLHFHPDGNAFPCCASDHTLPLGNYKNSNLKDLWNSKGMKKLRRNMLEGKASPECARCYMFEDKFGSLRMRANRKYKKHWHLVESTHADGTLSKMEMRFLDIRFSNLCNFRCRTCNPIFSSAIHQESEKSGPGVIEVDSSERLWNELQPLLLDVEEVYFAGGEPLVSEEHYKILDHWLKHNHTDVSLTYATNFSHFNFRGKSVLDYWKRFPLVEVRASLDASGARAELLRKGTRWQQIVENRQKMMQECPHVAFQISPTISVFNIWHFPDFHLEWVRNGLVELNNFRFNMLIEPPHLSIQTLPQDHKKKVAEKYLRSLEEILRVASATDSEKQQITKEYQSIVDFMCADDLGRLRPQFLEVTERLDQLRAENFRQVFPELAEL